jgi:hypothetical protein
MHAKSPRWPAPRGATRSCRLGVLGHVPLSRLVRRRGWPCAGYSGLVNPSSGVFVCWNKISAHECRQSLGRLLGRAAVMVTRYERIERMVPHRMAIFIVADALKIKAITPSFGDRRKMKRLLRKTDDRGYKIVPSAARPYFLPCARRTLYKCCVASIGPIESAPQRDPFAELVGDSPTARHVPRSESSWSAGPRRADISSNHHPEPRGGSGARTGDCLFRRKSETGNPPLKLCPGPCSCGATVLARPRYP